MGIGIFGGTFNPPHKGHLLAAKAAMETLALDRLYIIPAGTPPHKPLSEGAPKPKGRYRMAQLLFAGEENMRVIDTEINRPGPSYTIDTVLEIEKRHPGKPLYLLMGTDMFSALNQWHRVEELLQRVTPAVFSRGQGPAETKWIVDKYAVTPTVIDHQALEISSTRLREILPERQGVEFLSDTLYSEIIRKGHYRARPDFAWLREQVYAQLKPNRVAHTQGTEEEAVRLAKYWGVNLHEAREAAILHDLTKGKSLEEQLRLCEKYDMIPDSVERKNAKLLHAKTGARLAKEIFGICDQVYAAIRWHTTGRPDMSTLEKVIYLADYIEPNRDFDGVDHLRQLAYADLDAALLWGLEQTMKELHEKIDRPHPQTAEAIAWYRNRGEVRG